jgi:hypothetical protein
LHMAIELVRLGMQGGHGISVAKVCNHPTTPLHLMAA